MKLFIRDGFLTGRCTLSPLFLIIMNIIFIALSVLAMRINRRYISSPDS